MYAMRWIVVRRACENQIVEVALDDDADFDIQKKVSDYVSAHLESWVLIYKKYVMSTSYKNVS